jgi:hypothetical protein
MPFIHLVLSTVKSISIKQSQYEQSNKRQIIDVDELLKEVMDVYNLMVILLE